MLQAHRPEQQPIRQVFIAILPSVTFINCATIASKQQNRAAQFCGEVEVDESSFDGHRKGKPGRGATGKVIVLGLLKRGGNVYTVSVANVQRKTPLPVIREKIKPDSVVYTNGHAAYNALDVPNLRISE